MKKLFTTALFSLFVLLCFAQQEQQYTQFMYNKLGLNAGYAGSRDAACITAIIRNQWMGLKGAPQTQMLSFNMPLLNKRVGVGLNLTRNTIGISQRITVDGLYAYRIRLGQGILALGIQASIRHLKNNYNDSDLVSITPSSADGSIPIGEQSKYVPNFGAGLYYTSDNFYVGFSAPRLIKNNIDFNDIGGIIGKEVQHYFFMAGVLFELSDNVDLQPQVLFKYADNSPFDADVNLSLIFSDKYTGGLTYRTGGSSVTGFGESLDLMVAAQVSPDILFGLSYDITLSDIKTYSNGSVEAVLRFCLGHSEGEEIINPRFF